MARTTRTRTTRTPATPQGDVPKGKKRCTKTGEVLPATTEFFYRDKSQKDGLSPWSKAAEKAYNKAYYASLKKAKAPRVRNIDNDKDREVYEKGMKGERVARKSKTQGDGANQKVARKGRVAKARAKKA